jgi:hypothetical protein
MEEVTQIYNKLKAFANDFLLGEKLYIKNPTHLHQLFQEIQTRSDFIFWFFDLNFFDEHEEEMLSLVKELFKYMKDFRKQFYDPLLVEDTEEFFQLLQVKLNLVKELHEYVRNFRVKMIANFLETELEDIQFLQLIKSNVVLEF